MNYSVAYLDRACTRRAPNRHDEYGFSPQGYPCVYLASVAQWIALAYIEFLSGDHFAHNDFTVYAHEKLFYPANREIGVVGWQKIPDASARVPVIFLGEEAGWYRLENPIVDLL